MLKGLPWLVTGRMATLAATFCLEQDGTQNHSYTLEQFCARYRTVYGDALPLT